MVPIVPRETHALAGGAVERRYDANQDGRIDYCEQVGPDGRVALLRFDLNGDGQFDLDVDRRRPASEDRHLVILIDSVPFEIVRELWDEGRFRLFHPPSRTISPFPVMTDLSFSEFFGVSPCPAVEAEFFDGNKLEGGYGYYVHDRNSPWLACTDYHMANIAHAVAYFDPDAWLDHELYYIQKYFLRSAKSPYIGYCVDGSALGAKLGRNGHVAGMMRVDRFCQRIMYETRGRVQITLMSDHGHNLLPSHRAPLSEFLERCGYRVGERLARPGDVVVPEFGVVTCGAVYTREPARVAADLTLMDGIDQVMFLEGDEVVVLSRDGRARIGRSGDAFRYAVERGDPLKMKAVWERLKQEGRIDSGGFVKDGELFEAAADQEYPDALHRVWRAFHGLVVHQPDVLLTTQEGWHCGSKLMSKMYDVRSAHGNLGPSSCGFVMTTAGPLPGVMRMENLRGELGKVGVPIQCVPSSK